MLTSCRARRADLVFCADLACHLSQLRAEARGQFISSSGHDHQAGQIVQLDLVPQPGNGKHTVRAAACPVHVDRDYETLRINTHALFRHLGLSTGNEAAT